jgi:hypothetical protein
MAGDIGEHGTNHARDPGMLFLYRLRTLDKSPLGTHYLAEAYPCATSLYKRGDY